MIRIAAVVAALAAGGCSLTLPVRGSVEGTGESFTGEATGYLDGAGNLTIRSAKTVCRGNFVYVSPRNGSGTFNCDDGRSGPFNFVSTGQRGTGTGRFGERRFTFTFGDF